VVVRLKPNIDFLLVGSHGGCWIGTPAVLALYVIIIIIICIIPHPPWPLLISDVGLKLEGTLINCSLL